MLQAQSAFPPCHFSNKSDYFAARHGVGLLCNVVYTGRFYEFFEERNGQWGLAHRQPIYEKGRIDLFDLSALFNLDAEALFHFP